MQTVQGVVVGDYEGADPALRGFYLQNTPANDDDNPATSDGLFIFNSNNNSVTVGQVVQVTGSVSDFGFGSQSSISPFAATFRKSRFLNSLPTVSGMLE